MTDEADEKSTSAEKPKRKRGARGGRKKRGKHGPKREARPTAGAAGYPRHTVRKALRIPKAILDQNAGKSCIDAEAAGFCGVKYHGPFAVEVSSALKYGFLQRPAAGQVAVTDLAKKVIRPQSSSDEIDGLREAILNAPVLSDVYKHYRGENIPDDQFFRNTLVDTFKIPDEKADEFRAVFMESLAEAQLI